MSAGPVVGALYCTSSVYVRDGKRRKLGALRDRPQHATEHSLSNCQPRALSVGSKRNHCALLDGRDVCVQMLR